MLEVNIDTAVVHSGSIVFGCTVKGPEGAWIRFVQTRVPVELFTYPLICEIMRAWDESGPDDEDQPTLPYTG